MSGEQILQEFLREYEAIIKTGSTKDMERLGTMVKKVMAWLCSYEPNIAEQALAMLCGDADGLGHAKNWLSETEAKDIIGQMQPPPTWSGEQVADILKRLGKPLEEKGQYNEWALVTTVCMILSDSGDTLRNLIGQPGHQGSAEEVLSAAYRLALDKLKDKDGRFAIRRYFDLD